MYNVPWLCQIAVSYFMLKTLLNIEGIFGGEGLFCSFDLPSPSISDELIQTKKHFEILKKLFVEFILLTNE